MATFLAVGAVLTAVVGAGAAVAQGVSQQQESERVAKEEQNQGRNEELARLKALRASLGAQRVGVAVSGISQTSASVQASVADQQQQFTIAQGESDIARSSRLATVRARGRSALAGGIIGGALRLTSSAREQFLLNN